MIFYEVTLEVDPSLAAELQKYMRHQHIPAILRTGCFRHIHFDRASSTRFRTCYEAESAADLERYLRDHAPALRLEFQGEFPDQVTVTRDTWVEQESWGAG